MAITDNFDRSDGDIGANWTDTPAPGCSVASNLAKGDGAGAEDLAGSRYSGSAWNNDQGSQGVWASAGEYPGLAVRMSSGVNWYCWFSNGSVQECIGGGAPAEIASIGYFITTVTNKFTAVGTTLECFEDGGSMGSVVDASLASGAPGMVFYGPDARLNNWEGTGESAGGVNLSALIGEPIVGSSIF